MIVITREPKERAAKGVYDPALGRDYLGYQEDNGGNLAWFEERKAGIMPSVQRSPYARRLGWLRPREWSPQLAEASFKTYPTTPSRTALRNVVSSEFMSTITIRTPVARIKVAQEMRGIEKAARSYNFAVAGLNDVFPRT